MASRLQSGESRHLVMYVEWACNFCSGSNFVDRSSDFGLDASCCEPSRQTKTEPWSLAAASSVASCATLTQRIALLPSGTSSALHAFCLRSHTRMLPSRSPEMSSAWLGWSATLLNGQLLSYSRWQPGARTSQILIVPSSDPVKNHLPSLW